MLCLTFEIKYNILTVYQHLYIPHSYNREIRLVTDREGPLGLEIEQALSHSYEITHLVKYFIK